MIVIFGALAEREGLCQENTAPRTVLRSWAGKAKEALNASK
jgi:hypothetical protein